MNPVQIYADAVGHSHEAACNATFAAGFEAGLAAAQANVVVEASPVVVEAEPTPSEDVPPVVEDVVPKSKK